MAKLKSIITSKSEKFLEKYLNNASPTGFEYEGQKLWLEYITPYIDEYITDTYGSVVGVINPKAKYKRNPKAKYNGNLKGKDKGDPKAKCKGKHQDVNKYDVLLYNDT